VDLDPLVELRGGAGETCLFGEGPGGFVVAGRPDQLGSLAARAEAAGVDVLPVGEAGGESVELSAAEAEVSLPLADAERAWRSLGERMESGVRA
jgi:hypothetical protein